MLWKNGAGTPLTDGNQDAYAHGITIQGTDVYSIAATYWKNGVPVRLSDSLTYGNVRQLLLKRG